MISVKTVLFTGRIQENIYFEDGDEGRILVKATAESRSDMAGHLLRYSKCFTTLIEGIIEGRTGKRRPDSSIFIR